MKFSVNINYVFRRAFFQDSPKDVIRLPDIGEVATKDEYLHQYRNRVANTPTGFSSLVKVAQFSHSVILNDYTQFAEKVYHSIMAL